MTAKTYPISIVTPVFKAEAFIQNTIDSVLRQSCVPTEWIFVDDGSPDKSFEIIEHLRNSNPPFKVVSLRQANSGPGKARNVAIRAASTENIAFLDQDDTWSPDKIEVCGKVLETLPADYAGICNGERHVMLESLADLKSPKVLSEHLYGPYEDDFYAVMLTKGNRLSTSALIIRKNYIVKAGYFDEDRDLFGVEDFDLWLRVAALGKFKFIPKVLGDYLIGVGFSYVNPKQKIHLSRLFWKHFKTPAKKLRSIERLSSLAQFLRYRLEGEAKLRLKALKSS